MPGQVLQHWLIHIVFAICEIIWFSRFPIRLHSFTFFIRNDIPIVLIRRLRGIYPVTEIQTCSGFTITEVIKFYLFVSFSVGRRAIDLIFFIEVNDFDNAGNERLIFPIDICCH